MAADILDLPCPVADRPSPFDRIVVSLADKTGNALRPWAEAGFTCYAVDIQHSIRKDRVVAVGSKGGQHPLRLGRRP